MLEREVKLAVPPGFVLPDLSDVAAGHEVVAREPRTLRTVYFDTPDLRIARWGCTLRWREPEGWTVKLSAAPGVVLSREEVSFGGDARAPAAPAVDLLAAYVRGDELAPVARLRTTRRATEVRDEDGRLAEIDDDEVSILDGRRVAGRFREIEVELDERASDDLLDALVDALEAAGATVTDPVPKHVRALGVAAMRPPEVDPQKVGPKSSIGDVIASTLGESVLKLMVNDPGVRLGADPEALHQYRVATRRLRSLIGTYAELVDPEWATSVRAQLGDIAGLLGPVRDADVLLERLRSHKQSLPRSDGAAFRELESRLTHDRDEARQVLLASMRAPDYAALVSRLVDAASSPPVSDGGVPAADVLPALVADLWEAVDRRVERASDEPTDDDLHRIRIRIKRLRYAAEVAGAVAGKPARAMARAARDAQDVLGDYHDATVAAGWLRSVAEASAPRSAFVAGILAGLELANAEHDASEWSRAWKRLQRKRLRSWL